MPRCRRYDRSLGRRRIRDSAARCRPHAGDARCQQPAPAVAIAISPARSEVFTAASIGISLRDGVSSPEELLRNADTAMYQAKARGRDRHAVFDQAMRDRVVALLQLETDLRRALSRAPIQLPEFQLRYQPIVALETRRIIGFEALVRWQHPDRGWIDPAEFIPLAEDTGLIVPLGQWILQEACEQLRSWQAQFSHCLPLSMSVNLSTKQFTQTNLMEQVHQILQQTQIRGLTIDLKLEITESAIMENPDKARALLQQLKELGVKLLIDDFGTGYSSLSYLHRFPFDMVKIDQSFVSGMDSRNDQSEIVRAIVSLAHTLDMKVIAEGVETVAQLTQLQALGAEYGQGYLFAQPLSAEAVEAMLGSIAP
ncbi:MAG: EAL domain-containing protein [Leptolyngbyaceae cyanobacterium SM1_3_5]|nr:EAL domain-containing protein [Leptolyngbyaceae cyanobacterium SM1_3_5]